MLGTIIFCSINLVFGILSAEFVNKICKKNCGAVFGYCFFLVIDTIYRFMKIKEGIYASFPLQHVIFALLTISIYMALFSYVIQQFSLKYESYFIKLFIYVFGCLIFGVISLGLVGQLFHDPIRFIISVVAFLFWGMVYKIFSQIKNWIKSLKKKE